MTIKIWKIRVWQDKNKDKVQERIKKMVQKIEDQMKDAHGILKGQVMLEGGEMKNVPSDEEPLDRVKPEPITKYYQTPEMVSPGEIGDYP